MLFCENFKTIFLPIVHEQIESRKSSFTQLYIPLVYIHMQKNRKIHVLLSGQLTSNMSRKWHKTGVFRSLTPITPPFLLRFACGVMHSTQHELMIRSACYVWLLGKVMTNTFVVQTRKFPKRQIEKSPIFTSNMNFFS